MRVTFVTTQLDLIAGGGSNYDRDLKARALIARGCTVEFITFFSYKNNLPKSLPYKVIEKQIYPKAFNFFSFQKEVTKILKEYEDNTDLYYIDGHVFLYGAGMYRKKGGRPTVAHFDNYYFPTGLIKPGILKGVKFFLRKQLEKFYLSETQNIIDLFVTTSGATRDLYVARGLEKNKFFILPPMMDFQVFESKEVYNCSNKSKFHILYAGRINQEKGLDVLIKAMNELQDLNICLDVFGDGPAKQEFVDLAEKLKIQNKINWQPFAPQKELGAIYKHASVFVMPTKWVEPFGMVAIEAMDRGVPVITSSNTGTVEAVGDAGLVFKQGDHHDLAEKIKKLILDKNLYSVLSQKSIKRSREFDHKIFGELFYQKLKTIKKMLGR